jgi:hypothetical protein
MARKEDADVDPRFDPVFQRGYDPAQHGRSAHRAASASHAATASTPSREMRPLTPAPRYRAPDPDERDVAEARRPAVVTGDADVVVEASAVDDEPAPPRANPFRVLLLVASIAAVGGAALLLWHRLEEDPYGGGYGSDVASTFAYQFTDALMVPLLTGGLIGFCLWLAIGALRKRDDG